MPLCAFRDGGMCVFVSVYVRPCLTLRASVHDKCPVFPRPSPIPPPLPPYLPPSRVEWVCVVCGMCVCVVCGMRCLARGWMGRCACACAFVCTCAVVIGCSWVYLSVCACSRVPWLWTRLRVHPSLFRCKTFHMHSTSLLYQDSEPGTIPNS